MGFFFITGHFHCGCLLFWLLPFGLMGADEPAKHSDECFSEEEGSCLFSAVSEQMAQRGNAGVA